MCGQSVCICVIFFFVGVSLFYVPMGVSVCVLVFHVYVSCVFHIQVPSGELAAVQEQLKDVSSVKGCESGFQFHVLDVRPAN